MISTRNIRSMLLSLAAVAALALALPSCSGSGADEPVPTGTVYHAGFYLTVGEIDDKAASRAPADGEYNRGEGLENYIDLTSNDKIRVAIYDLADNFLGQITEFTITPLETFDSSKRYFLKGTTTVDISSGKFKVMILANWPSYPSNLSLSSVWKQEFKYAPGLPSKERPIPMYGITKVDVPAVKPDVPVDLGTIHLLRAVAKIEVIYEDSTDYWPINNISLTHYNNIGFCAPAISKQEDYVKDSWDRDYVGRPFIPSTPDRQTDVPFEKIDDTHYVLYVTEYSNTRNDTPEARICVDFSNSSNGKRYISFKDPAYHNTIDLMRNLWYRIIIKKKPEYNDVSFEVDVVPYTVCDLDPIFGLIKPKNNPSTSNEQ